MACPLRGEGVMAVAPLTCLSMTVSEPCNRDAALEGPDEDD